MRFSLSGLLLKLVLLVVLLAGSAIAANLFMPGGLRELLADDPPRSDYAWLRRELVVADELAEQALRGARRGGNMAAARALQQAILASRASARSTPTQPIPRGVREKLADYFPEDVLEEVRWAFPNRNLDLGTLVAWYKAEGGAVTLLDTIIYAGRAGVESDYLWAHELTHVLQYRELGLADFTRIYATNPQLLERQARDNGNRIVRDLRARAQAAATEPERDGENE